MIEKNRNFIPDWKNVEDYLEKDTEDSIKLAIIEAEKIFIKIVKTKGYKAKKTEEMISRAVKELKNPDSFLRLRESVLRFFSEPGYAIYNDPYSGKELVSSYKGVIEELLFGSIDEIKLNSFKYRIWPIYFFLYSKRKTLKLILIWLFIIILTMLFIADTNLGRNFFDLLIEKIHFIIRLIITIILGIFVVFFFVTLSVVLFESKARKRSQKNKE